MSNRITIYDIAKQAGVSPATVSKVLNNRYGVDASTKDKITKILLATGYKPHHDTPVQRVIGMVVQPYKGIFQSSYCCTLLDSALESLTRAGYILQILQLPMDNFKAAYKMLQTYTQSSLCGIIGIAAPPYYKIFNNFLKEYSAFPSVIIGKIGDDINEDSNLKQRIIQVDDYTAGYQLAKMMLRNNHKTFCLVSAMLNDLGHKHRLKGMQDALKEENIPQKNIKCLECPDFLYRRGNQLAVATACSPNPPPEAFLFTDAFICSGFATGCRDMHINIPDAFSVAGFEDNHELERLPIPITAMRIPADQICDLAIRNLLAQIGRTTIPQFAPIEHILTLRDSVKKR